MQSKTKRRLFVASVITLGLGALLGWKEYAVRCDNDQLASDLVHIEQLASRSSNMRDAQRAANRALVASCEGAPAWVADELRYQNMSDGWPDWVRSGRDRSLVESWMYCDFDDAQSVLDFDARAQGMNHCGFEWLSALTPAEHLELGEIEFGFWAAGAYLERAGASPALLRRYYRVLLLAIDSSEPQLLVEPGRILNLWEDDAVVAPQELAQQEFAGRSVAIDARTPALQLDWPRVRRVSHVVYWATELRPSTETWVLEQRSTTGLPVSAAVSVVELASAVKPFEVLKLELDGWRWGTGALQPYASLDPRARHPAWSGSGERLLVVIDGELTASHFIPVLAVLWRALEDAPNTPEALSIAID